MINYFLWTKNIKNTMHIDPAFFSPNQQEQMLLHLLTQVFPIIHPKICQEVLYSFIMERAYWKINFAYQMYKFLKSNVYLCVLSVHYNINVFNNGLGDLGSIPGQIIPKTLKMVLDTSLLNTQQYKVRIKGKVEQSRERSSTLLYILV